MKTEKDLYRVLPNIHLAGMLLPQDIRYHDKLIVNRIRLKFHLKQITNHNCLLGFHLLYNFERC